MSTNAERFDRLPKWAQRELTNLREQVADMKAERTADWADTDTEVEDFRNGSQTLRPGSRIRFHLDRVPGRLEVRSTVTAYVQDGTLVLHGSGAFHIYPEVTNLARVALGGTVDRDRLVRSEL